MIPAVPKYQGGLKTVPFAWLPERMKELIRKFVDVTCKACGGQGYVVTKRAMYLCKKCVEKRRRRTES